MDERAPAPRVLLAEDDPVSARFLAEALGLLGARVDTRGDGPTALAAAQLQRYDLLLLDLGLPGLDGAGVLRALRADAGAASRGARAIATSAAPPAGAACKAAGFAGLLRKPATVEAIADLLGRGLPRVGEPRPAAAEPVLDDAAALAALGGIDAVADLRRLLAAELPGQLATLHAALAAGDTPTARTILHRLHASTRFCGAAALAAAGTALQQALDARAGTGSRDAALAALGAAADDYRQRVNR